MNLAIVHQNGVAAAANVPSAGTVGAPKDLTTCIRHAAAAGVVTVSGKTNATANDPYLPQ